jgi:asparagine synthase (glutamine-hydrolysing)
MCGIAGWVDFGRDLRELRPVVERMTDSVHRRGPDASGVWIEAHVALGHRRLAVIDLEGGRQPMRVTEEGHEFVVTFSGEIYNFRRLRAELTDRGHRFTTSSDTEVLLRSYVEWGEAFLSRLDGMFAFAIWDGARRRALLGRDRMGIKPLYYAATDNGQGIVFGSEPKAVLESGQLRAEVDAAGLREVLDMVKTPGAAVFRGMRELQPGDYLICDAQGTTEKRYWRLEAAEHTDDLDTTVARVRELLGDVVRDQLVSDVPICTLLSGGLDSSAITALAAEQVNPLRTFAVDFLAGQDGFARDAVRHSPDSPHARTLAEALGTDHREILLDPADLLDPDVRDTVLAATDLPPAYWGDMWPSLLLLFREVRRESTVALSGEGADELFGGYQWFFNANAIEGSTFPWLTSGSSRYFGGGKLFDRGFLDTLQLDQARKQSYADAVADAPVLDGEDPQEARMRTVSYLNITRFMRTLLDRKDRMSMATALEVRVPFCDHRLVEYVFNAPWRFKSFDGREKSLLRAAMRDHLPASILDRKKNPYPAIQDGRYEAALRTMLADIVGEPSSPVLPLLDTVKTTAQLQRDTGRVSLPYARGSLEMVIWLNTWLRRYDVTVRL